MLWGCESWAVAFLSTLRYSLDEVAAVVNINPRRWDRFMPGVAQRIISPDHLADRETDQVIVMNPIYRQEISSMLQARGISADVMPV